MCLIFLDGASVLLQLYRIFSHPVAGLLQKVLSNLHERHKIRSALFS